MRIMSRSTPHGYSAIIWNNNIATVVVIVVVRPPFVTVYVMVDNVEPEAQVGPPTAVLSNVTAAVEAKARPFKVEPLFKVMLVPTKIFPII
jgi:hypothetical protein